MTTRTHKLSVISVLIFSSVFGGNVAADSTPPQNSGWVGYQSVFDGAMDDPNVMMYHSDKAYQAKDYNEALRWALAAARYEHPAAITNAKVLIQSNLGTIANREAVIEFLRYYAEPHSGAPADQFAQIYLADFYRGDTCVWTSDKKTGSCPGGESSKGPMAGLDLTQSYYFYTSAAEQGNERAQYATGMMDILALGTTRNVPKGISLLRPLADRGNVPVSYLLGLIYQRGDWMLQDKEEASKFFEIAAKSNHPGALLELAANAESGVVGNFGADTSARHGYASRQYLAVLDGVLANDEQRARAAYRLGLLYSQAPSMVDVDKAAKFMADAARFGEKAANESSVLALLWLGNKVEKVNLATAVSHYEAALSVVKKLPLNVQQRQGQVWELLANAYGRGQDGNFDRDQRLYAKYMNEKRIVQEKVFVPINSPYEYQGYSAFVM